LTFENNDVDSTEKIRIVRKGVGMGFIIGLIITVYWIVQIVDCLKSDFSGYNKIIWILVLIFLGPLGAIIYSFVGKDQKIS
jgi:hypothetical protein